MTTPRQFMAMLQPMTLLGISAACLKNPQLNLWVMQLVAAQQVNITDPDTREGIETMVGAGLMSREEADSVIAALSDDVPPVRSITETTSAVGQPLPDGRFYLTIRHALTDGSVETQTILCEAGTDVEAFVAEQAARMNAIFMGAGRG